MKAKTFENLIRKVVREEIDYALRREIKSLKEDLNKDIKPIIQEQPIPDEVKNSLKEKIMGNKPLNQKPHTPKSFTSNPTLNDLLNETAMGDTNTNSPGMSPVSMEGEFNNVGGVPVEEAPKAVVEAVNRDYSQLMKAIDKKRNK
jgi:hypothetical protein